MNLSVFRLPYLGFLDKNYIVVVLDILGLILCSSLEHKLRHSLRPLDSVNSGNFGTGPTISFDSKIGTFSFYVIFVF